MFVLLYPITSWYCLQIFSIGLWSILNPANLYRAFHIWLELIVIIIFLMQAFHRLQRESGFYFTWALICILKGRANVFVSDWFIYLIHIHVLLYSLCQTKLAVNGWIRVIVQKSLTKSLLEVWKLQKRLNLVTFIGEFRFRRNCWFNFIFSNCCRNNQTFLTRALTGRLKLRLWLCVVLRRNLLYFFRNSKPTNCVLEIQLRLGYILGETTSN